MRHTTTEKWETTVGPNDETKMVLNTKDDIYYDFAIYDYIDSRSNFFLYTTLSNLEQIAAAISKLVGAARSKK